LPNLPAAEYRFHAYKLSEGYPDTFFAFFANNNKNASKTVSVTAGRTITVHLALGPKCAKLRVIIRNEYGIPVDGGLSFTRAGEETSEYSIGVKADSEFLVPLVPFEVEVTANNYETWKSSILTPRSEETIKLNVRLTPSRQIPLHLESVKTLLTSHKSN